MLTKRLLFRKSFVALLVVIPLLGGAMALGAKEDSGIVTVILVANGAKDEPSRKIVSSLLDEENTSIRFIEYESEEGAKDEVRYGRADALWIFHEGIDDLIDAYLSGDYSAKLATSYIRSDSALQRLIIERMNDALFPYVSAHLSSRFTKDALDAEGYEFSDDAMREYYEASEFKGDIVKFTYLSTSSQLSGNQDHLTSPVRGMAYLAAFLCTLASTLFCMEDEKRGFFSRLPGDGRFFVFFASNFASSIISSGVALISIALCGAFTTLGRELTASLVFALSSCALCTLFGRAFPTTFALGAATPPLILVMAVVCPVFISIKLPVAPDLLFPLTYAVRAIRTPRYILFALIYVFVLTALSYAADVARRRMR